MAATKEELVERQTTVWDLRTRYGWTQDRIAEELGINQSTVSRDLKKMSKRVLERLDDQIEQEKATQLAQLRAIVHESLQAWHDSKNRHTEVSEQSKVIGEGEDRLVVGTTITSKVVEREGSVQYLNAAMSAMEEIRKIFKISPIELIVDWRKEAQEAGLDDSQLFEQIVQEAYEKIVNENGDA